LSRTRSSSDPPRGPASDPVNRRSQCIDSAGPLALSSDGGQTWQDPGNTGGEPQPTFADTADHLLVALIDGTVKHSTTAAAPDRLAIGLLSGLGLLLGLAVAPLVADYASADPSALWQAAGVTAAFVAATGAYGYATR
jgi:hypothetical protein